MQKPSFSSGYSHPSWLCFGQERAFKIGGSDKTPVPLTFFVFKVRLCSYVGPLWQNRWKIFWERFWHTEFLFPINHVSLAPPPKKKKKKKKKTPKHPETYPKIKNILFIFISCYTGLLSYAESASTGHCNEPVGPENYVPRGTRSSTACWTDVEWA